MHINMFENKLHSFSPDGSLLAICASNGDLKLWDTSSGILEHEFQPAEHLSSSATCLAFTPKVKAPQDNVKKKKKRRSCSSNEKDMCGAQLLAMGTMEGMILIFSPSQQEIVSKLHHSSTISVTDLCWQSENKLISLGQDKSLVMWDIASRKKLRKFDVKGSSSVCVLGENRFGIASNNLHLLSYNLDTNEEVSSTLSGHKTPIIQLTPIILNEESEARYLLSAAENDKYIYAWSTDAGVNEPVACFTAKDTVKTFSYVNTSESSVGISVTTTKGILRYFSHHLNGSRSEKSISSQGVLKIFSEAKSEKTPLTIINSHFLSSSSLIVVYGTEFHPLCELLDVADLEGKVTWVRKDPSLYSGTKKSSILNQTKTPLKGDHALHVTPSPMNSIHELNSKKRKGKKALVLPNEEKKDALLPTLPLLGKGRPLDHYVHLLIEAVLSKDSTLLNNIIAKDEDEEVITNTIRRLPTTHVVPFLRYLQEVMVGKGPKNLSCVYWIKAILHHHMSYLSTLHDKEEIMQPFKTFSVSRLKALSAITMLQSRISLLLTHVKIRHENADQKSSSNQNDALLMYRDESSDEEDNIRMEAGGAPSESEDIWDDWTEEGDEVVKGELNCNSDNDEINDINCERNSEGNAIKRKSFDNNVYIYGDDGVGSDDEILESDENICVDSDDQ